MSDWRGHKSALSLTFDDGLPCQQEFALPAMREFDIQGTFFLIQHSPYEPTSAFPKEIWVQALLDGHEIGSHSSTHQKAADLDVHTAHVECIKAKEFLERQLKTPISSFCYPYTDAPGWLQRVVKQTGHKQARGGRVAREDKYVDRKEGVNLLNVPCYHVAEALFIDDAIYKMIEETMRRKTWLTLMFHGVGPDASQWDNVTLESFRKLMSFLQWMKKDGLWVAPFGTIAEVFQ